MMITGVQVRMARSALGWNVRDLAQAAEINPNTVTRFEMGGGIQARTMGVLQAALEGAGVQFIDRNGGGPGVRLKE